MRQPRFRRIETTWSVLVLVAVAALAVGCGQAVASGNPLAQGWSWYQDGHYPFRVPIPPGWETATFSNTETGIQGCSYYEVYLFPPGRTPRSERGLEEHEPRLMTITLNLGCQPYYPEQANAGGLRWVPEKAPVTVSGLQVPMYDRNDPAGEMDRDALATFGGNQYELYIQTQGASAQGDIAAYRYLVQHFQYTGPAS